MIINSEIRQNRALFLSELRSGKYSKGCIKSDEKGNPVFENDSEKEGHCCCAIMAHLFGWTPTGILSLSRATKALGITSKECKIIQSEINDRNSTLIEDADVIENKIFNKY